MLIQSLYANRPAKCPHRSGEKESGSTSAVVDWSRCSETQLAAVSYLPCFTSNWPGLGSLVLPQCGFVRASRHACVITCSPGELPLPG